jgi:hypothetical protein
VTIARDYGLASYRWSSTKADLAGNPYYFRVVAEVTGLSFAGGSSAGGTALKISGSGFPSNITRLSININGSNCVVTSVTNNNEIDCTTGASTGQTSDFYFGSSGINY